MRDHQALVVLIDARLNAPFAWGEHDCATFAFDAALAQTGVDAFADERGRYRTARGAARAIARYGDLPGVVDARFEPVAPALAQRGDIALVPSGRPGGETTLAVVEGATVVAPGEFMLSRLPRSAILAAWSVDHPRER